MIFGEIRKQQLPVGFFETDQANYLYTGYLLVVFEQFAAMRHVLPTLLILGPTYVYSQGDCVLDKDRNGIKVFICSTEEDKFKTVRVQFIAKNATISKLEKIIEDVPGYTKWQFQVTEASILERKDSNEFVYRTRLSTPAFIDDREMVVRLKKERDTKVRRLDVIIKTDPFPYPFEDDLVRVPESITTWSVIGIGENSIHITYTLSMDPGGNLPVWVVNEALAVAPYETFNNLKKMLE